VFTVRAGEPYAPMHALDAVGFHSCIVTRSEPYGALDGVAAKVTGVKEPNRRGGGRRFLRQGSSAGGARPAVAPSCRGQEWPSHIIITSPGGCIFSALRAGGRGAAR
jgi:hypothetical protein